MRLYIMRHGVAEEQEAGRADFDRRLTAEGAVETGAVADGLAALKVRPQRLLTSPYPRARETAEIVAARLEAERALVEVRALGCGATPADLLAALSGSSPEDSVLVVGHEPDLSGMIAALIGGGQVRMKKAAVARVDAHPVRLGGGELRWLMEARHLARLGE